MKTASIIAVSSFALAGLVGAAPLINAQNDYIVYTTTTEEVWETTWTTTTIWIDDIVPTGTAKTTSVPAFYEAPKQYGSSTTLSTSTTSIVSPEVAAPVAASTPKTSPTPSPSTTTPVYVAPTPTTTSVYVAPTTEAPAVVVPTTTAAPVTTTTAAAQSAAAPAAKAGSGTGANTGDMTYYDVEVGLGSCGLPGKNSESLVALAPADMANGANPNANPHCGKTINIYYNGAVTTATVHDTCPGCATGSIDVTDTLFAKVAPNGDGRVHGVSWSFA